MVDNKKVTSMGVACLVFFLSQASFLGIGIYNIFQTARTGSYISGILGFIIGFIPLSLIIYIMNNSENNIIENINEKFGKILGNTINIILSVLFFIYSIILLHSLIDFIKINYLPQTSYIYIGIIIIMGLIYGLSKGLETVVRASYIFIYLNIFLFILTFLGLINNFKLDNLLPVIDTGINNTIISSFIYTLLNVTPIFLIGLIGKKNVVDNEKYKKSIIYMYIFSNIILISIIVFTILVLGFPLSSIYKYPEYMMLKKVSILSVIERMENTLAVSYIFNILITILLSHLFVLKNFKNYFKKTIANKVIVYIIPIVVLFISIFNKKLFEQSIINVFLYYIFPICIFIVILFLCIKTLYLKLKSCIKK